MYPPSVLKGVFMHFHIVDKGSRSSRSTLSNDNTAEALSITFEATPGNKSRGL